MALATHAALPSYPAPYTNTLVAAILAYGTPGADFAIGAARVAVAMKRWDADPDGGRLFGWVLEDQRAHPAAELQAAHLKGRDRAVHEVLKRAQALTPFELHLGVVEDRRLGGGPLGASGRIQADARVTHVECWAEARLPHAPVDPLRQLYPPEPFADLRESSSAFVRAGGVVRTQQRYHLAAILFWPPRRTFDIVSADGPSLAIDYFDRAAALGEHQLHEFADRIFRLLSKTEELARLTPRAAAHLVSVLSAHNEELLLLRFLADFAANFIADETFRAALPPALRVLRWDAAVPVLARLFAYLAALHPPDALPFYLLLCPLPLLPARRAYLRDLAASLVPLVRRNIGRCTAADEPELRRLLEVLSALDLDDFMDQIAADVVATAPELAEGLLCDLSRNLHASRAYALLLTAAIPTAERREKETAPASLQAEDWTIRAEIRCCVKSCRDCLELQRFLREPSEHEWHLHSADTLRHHHLTKVIDGLGLGAFVAGETVFQRSGGLQGAPPRVRHYRVWKRAEENFKSATERHAQAVATLRALREAHHQLVAAGAKRHAEAEAEAEAGAEAEAEAKGEPTEGSAKKRRSAQPQLKRSV